MKKRGRTFWNISRFSFNEKQVNFQLYRKIMDDMSRRKPFNIQLAKIQLPESTAATFMISPYKNKRANNRYLLQHALDNINNW